MLINHLFFGVEHLVKSLNSKKMVATLILNQNRIKRHNLLFVEKKYWKIKNKLIQLFLLPVFLFSTINFSFAQNKQLNGRIIDKQTNASIAFAHVGIPQIGIGVVSNESGRFSFYYPQSAENDTLLISFLGYRTKQIVIKNYSKLTQNDTLKIELIPDIISLQEIVIFNNTDSAKKILKKAIDRFKKNYPTKPFQMNAFFREKVQNRDDYRFTQLFEGMLDIRDWGIKSDPKKIRIRLNEFRKSDDYAKRGFSLWERKKIFGEENDLYDILIQDPIRIHLINKIERSDVGGIVAYGGSFRNELEVILTEPKSTIRIVDVTSYDGEPVFNLKFRYYSRTGNLFVNCNDYGIHHIDMYYSNLTSIESLPEHLRRSAEESSKSTHFEEQYMDKLNIDYQKIKGKYYLSFINWLTLGDSRQSNVSQGKKTYSYKTCTLMINSIQTERDEMDKIKPRETIDRDENISKTKAKYNEEFWRNYNILLASPIEAKVIRDLTFKESLEEQYKKN